MDLKTCNSSDNIADLSTYGTYGLQNKNAIGYNNNPRIGVIEFSNDDHVGTNCSSNLQTDGKCYSTYEGSLVEEYVNDYIDKIKPIFGENIEGRLIYKNEIRALKRYYSGNETVNIDGSCESIGSWTVTSGLNMPTWLWSTSYWSASSYGKSNVFYWQHRPDAMFRTYIEYSNIFDNGVRPVIEFII